MDGLCRNENIDMNSKIFRKIGQDQGLRVNKEWRLSRPWKLTTRLQEQ